MKRKIISRIRTSTCMAGVQTISEYWKLMAVKDLGWGLNCVVFWFCLVWFGFEPDSSDSNMAKRDIRSICVPIILCTFLYTWELNRVLHSLSLPLGHLYNLSLRAGHWSIIQHCCWTEWVASLFGLFCELYFFFFWSSIILPMITLCLLKRETWVCQEGHDGSGEGGWGDYVCSSQDWPPIVIFSSQGESWRFSNIDSRIIPLCYTIFEMETVSMKFLPQQTFLPPVPTEALPLWP